MSEGPITLELPMPPNIANGAHSHWRSRHNAKLDYWAILDALQNAGVYPRVTWTRRVMKVTNLVAPPPPKQPFKKASIRSTMYLGAAMDDSNAMRRHKWIEDWLKTRGYIVDDRKKCLTWEGFPEQVVKRDGNYRVVITLTPLAA